MASSVDQLISQIKDLELPAALAVLIGQKVLNLSQKGMEKIKQLIKDKQNEGKYAFVPDKEEANKLSQFCGNPEYQQIHQLIPNYWGNNLLLTGLLIRDYQEEGGKKNNQRIALIKKQIWQRPNGKHLIKVVDLPTTPVFSVILGFLYDLKTSGYTTQRRRHFYKLWFCIPTGLFLFYR